MLRTCCCNAALSGCNQLPCLLPHRSTRLFKGPGECSRALSSVKPQLTVCMSFPLHVVRGLQTLVEVPSWVAEVKAEPSSAVKRRSPVQPALQPAAKKGRLLRQRSPPASAVDASMDSDETMEECLSPRRTAKARKNAVESDDDEDYVVPGQLAG